MHINLEATCHEGNRCQFVVWARLGEKGECLFTAAWPQLTKTLEAIARFALSFAAEGGLSLGFDATRIG